MRKTLTKKCKICGKAFEARSSTALVCCLEHAIEYSSKKAVKERAIKAKQERQERREAKIKLKTRGWYIKEAQKAVNAFIRERDKDEPCISCNNFRNGYDAGHFLSRSVRPELRFHEDNIHKQCKYCNNYDKGTAAAGYRTNLINRIGFDKVLALEAPYPPAKWTIPELIEIKRTYQKKRKELKNAE